ncbi:hypothetical protein LguiA_025872 [Lonicera macranthoides]
MTRTRIVFSSQANGSATLNVEDARTLESREVDGSQLVVRTRKNIRLISWLKRLGWITSPKIKASIIQATSYALFIIFSTYTPPWLLELGIGALNLGLCIINSRMRLRLDPPVLHLRPHHKHNPSTASLSASSSRCFRLQHHEQKTAKEAYNMLGDTRKTESEQDNEDAPTETRRKKRHEDTPTEIASTTETLLASRSSRKAKAPPPKKTKCIFRDYDYGFVKLMAFDHSNLLFEYKKSRDGKVYDSFRILRDYRDILACTVDSCPSTTLAS